jgi:hypothetical protein
MHHFARHVSTRLRGRKRGNFRNCVGNFQHLGILESPHIVRLPARGRVEGRPVEYHPPTIAFALAGNHLRVKFPQKRIVIVEPFSQRCSFPDEFAESPEYHGA